MSTLDYFRLRVGLTSRSAIIGFACSFFAIGAISYQLSRSIGLMASADEEAPWAATSPIAVAAVAGLYQAAVVFVIFMAVSMCHQFSEHGYHWLGSAVANRRHVVGLEVRFCGIAALVAAAGLVLSLLVLGGVTVLQEPNGASSLIGLVGSSVFTLVVVWAALFCCGLFSQLIAHLFRSVAMSIAICAVVPMFVEPIVATQLSQLKWALPVYGVIASAREVLNHGWSIGPVFGLTSFALLAVLLTVARFRKETIA